MEDLQAIYDSLERARDERIPHEEKTLLNAAAVSVMLALKRAQYFDAEPQLEQLTQEGE